MKNKGNRIARESSRRSAGHHLGFFNLNYKLKLNKIENCFVFLRWLGVGLRWRGHHLIPVGALSKTNGALAKLQ